MAADMHGIADDLPVTQRARAHEIHRTADRLHAAAELLSAEVNATEFGNARLVAKIGRSALAAAAALLIGGATGVAEGAGARMYGDLTGLSETADACLARVEEVADELIAIESSAEQRAPLPEAFVLAGEGTNWIVSSTGDRGLQRTVEFTSKADATDAAIAIVGQQGGGQVTIYDRANSVDRVIVVHESPRDDGSK